jgi:hypothetical protein
MAQAAFAPKSGFEDPDTHGTIFVSDGVSINVRDALTEGGGTIITDDPALINVLDAYEPLKRVSVSAAEEQASGGEEEKEPERDKSASKSRKGDS